MNLTVLFSSDVVPRYSGPLKHLDIFGLF